MSDGDGHYRSDNWPEDRGYTRLSRDKVMQADEGCEFAVLRGGSEPVSEPVSDVLTRP